MSRRHSYGNNHSTDTDFTLVNVTEYLIHMQILHARYSLQNVP